jgi:hypothetical protein
MKVEDVLNRVKRTIGKAACRDKIASINNLVMKVSPTIFDACNRYSFVAIENISVVCFEVSTVLMLCCIGGLADPDALKECLYLLTLLQSVTSHKTRIVITSFVANRG